jgi:small neutral amino acid transporter SnatA (MarC family)
VDKYNIIPTFISLLVNMLFVWFTLVKADGIMHALGTSGTRAFSKIMYILLGAIGVMMIRHGIQALII